MDGNAGPGQRTSGDRGSMQDPGIPFFSGRECSQSRLGVLEPGRKELGGEMENPERT